MKLITAIIQPDRLDHVREALIQADITRITVSRVTGHGRQEDIEYYRGQKIAPNLLPKVRLDIAVNEQFVNVTVALPTYRSPFVVCIVPPTVTAAPVASPLGICTGTTLMPTFLSGSST